MNSVILKPDRELIPPTENKKPRVYVRDGSQPKRARRSKKKTKAPKPKIVFNTGKRGRPERDSVMIPLYLSRELADVIRPIRQRSKWIEQAILHELHRIYQKHGKQWRDMPETLSDALESTKPKKRGKGSA